MFQTLIRHLQKLMVAGALLTTSSMVIVAEPYQTVINNGSPLNRVDIAVLGDGYTAAQMTLYQTQVLSFFQSVFGQEPYREYQRFYNVHRIDVISNQSGADHSDRNPPVFVDTALDAAYNCAGIQRLICVNTTKVFDVINRTLPANHYDVILVIVNDSEYGGSGGTVAVASIDPSAVELILHEVGHSFGLLADEYAGGGPSCNPNIEPSQPNATMQTVRALIKWNYWIDATTPIPTTTTTPALPGLYVGANYCDTGLYRPTYNNKMRNLGVPFEQINTEQHVKRVYSFVSPIDSSLPAGMTVTINSNQSQTFSVTTPQPFTHSLSINWFVDGLPRNSGPSFLHVGGTLPAGNHTVRAVITDTTPFVRNDPQQLLTENRDWTLSIQPAAERIPFDFDGDGKTDVSVFRPSTNYWYILNSSSNFFRAEVFGTTGDLIVPEDYDGDGKTDIAVWRPSTGFWYSIDSSKGAFRYSVFGQNGDIPAPADFDGDGKADVTVYRPSTGIWFSLLSSNNAFSAVQFGLNGDVPVAADYDGDGKADINLYRPSTGVWYRLNSTNNSFYAVQFGLSSDKAVAGDFDGDGKADITVWRPSNGGWYIYRSSNGVVQGTVFGSAGDIPTPADFDGDGKTDVSVFRPSTSIWYRMNSSDNSFGASQFGISTDNPVPSYYIQ